MTPAEQRAQCIRSYFTQGAIDGSEDLEFVCGDDDFRNLARRLYALTEADDPTDAGADAALLPEVVDGGLLVVKAAAPRQPPLGWYELVALGIIRQGCCAVASPARLPLTRGQCLQLQPVVRRIAEESQQAGDVTPVAREFEEAVTCLLANGIDNPYAYDELPTAAHRGAFQKFLQRAAEGDAKRASRRRAR